MGQWLFVAAGWLHDEVDGGVPRLPLHGLRQTLHAAGVVRVLAEVGGLLLVSGYGDIQRLAADVDPNDEGGHGVRSWSTDYTTTGCPGGSPGDLVYGLGAYDSLRLPGP